MIRALLVLTLLTLTPATSAFASACGCPGSLDYEATIAQSDAIFEGVALETEWSGITERRTHFEVLKAWKGVKVGSRVSVGYYFYDEDDCSGRPYREGKITVVSAEQADDGLETKGCVREIAKSPNFRAALEKIYPNEHAE